MQPHHIWYPIRDGIDVSAVGHAIEPSSNVDLDIFREKDSEGKGVLPQTDFEKHAAWCNYFQKIVIEHS
jgi:hypothetical protein